MQNLSKPRMVCMAAMGFISAAVTSTSTSVGPMGTRIDITLFAVVIAGTGEAISIGTTLRTTTGTLVNSCRTAITTITSPATGTCTATATGMSTGAAITDRRIEFSKVTFPGADGLAGLGESVRVSASKSLE